MIKECVACGDRVTPKPFTSQVTCGQSECQEREAKQNRERNAVSALRLDSDPVVVTSWEGNTGTVKKHSKDTYFFSIPGSSRARWGTLKQILEDVRYFHVHGVFPPLKV